MALAGMTARGRAFLAAGITSAAAGVILDQRDLVRIGVLLLALPLTAAAFLTRSRYRISAKRRLDRSRAPVGSVVRVELDVRNVSRVISPMLLAQDALPAELGAVAGGGARFVLQRIPANREVTVSYAVRPVQRGRYPVGPLSVRLADPFGFCQIVRTFASMDSMSVLPAITPLSAGRMGGKWTTGGETRQRGVTTGDEQDSTTRPYRSGDDRRRVHWRTTARTGELSVRREEQPWQSRATLLVDTRGSAHSPGQPSGSFEFAVSAAASIATALIRAGYGLRLTDDIARIIADSHTSGGEAGFAIMDALCEMQRNENETLLPVANRLGHEGQGRGAIVAILGRLRPGDDTALARPSNSGIRRMALLIDADAWTPGVHHPGMAKAADQRDTLRRAGWTVAVASPQSSIEALWHELNTLEQVETRRWVG